MRGYTYFKATDEYFNNLFSERGILFTDSDKKGLMGVWAKYNIKHNLILYFKCCYAHKNKQVLR